MAAGDENRTSKMDSEPIWVHRIPGRSRRDKRTALFLVPDGPVNMPAAQMFPGMGSETEEDPNP